MENLLDPSKYARIYSVAFEKSTWLKNVDKDTDTEGKFSFLVLSKIIEGEDEDLLDRIQDNYQSVRRASGTKFSDMALNGIVFSLNLYSILWSRMFVILYFFYHNNPLWKEGGGFEEMLSLIENEALKKDVDKCIARIDEYIEKRTKFKQKCATLKSKDTNSPTSKQMYDNAVFSESMKQIIDLKQQNELLKNQLRKCQDDLERRNIENSKLIKEMDFWSKRYLLIEKSNASKNTEDNNARDNKNVNDTNGLPMSFFITDNFTSDQCQQKLITIINDAKSKSIACQEIWKYADKGYFRLSDKSYPETANLINTWISKTNKKWTFTADDFGKARKKILKK